jgi:hypothetical protein
MVAGAGRPLRRGRSGWPDSVGQGGLYLGDDLVALDGTLRDRSVERTSVGRLVVSEFVTLDGVMEAPGFDEHRDGKNAWALRGTSEDQQRFMVDELFPQSTVEGFAVMRFTSTGALDPTFDTDGKVITTFNEGQVGITELAITSTGKIVAAGGPGVACYTSSGQRDAAFSGDGRVWLTDPFYGWLNVEGIAIQGGAVVSAWDNIDFMGLTRILL